MLSIQSISAYRNTKYGIIYSDKNSLNKRNTNLSFGSGIINPIISKYMQILANPAKALAMKEKGIRVLKRDCIEQLKNDKLKKLCEIVFEKSPVEMFVVPASSQGKNHPADEFYPGSMVKHTKRVFQMAKYAITRYGLDEKEQDLVLTAAMLHDFPTKFIPDGAIAYKKGVDHAVNNAIFIENEMKQMGFEEKIIEKVCAGVGFHSGRFDAHVNKDWLERYKMYQNTPYAFIVQEADYYASRPQVFVKID